MSKEMSFQIFTPLYFFDADWLSSEVCIKVFFGVWVDLVLLWDTWLVNNWRVRMAVYY